MRLSALICSGFLALALAASHGFSQTEQIPAGSKFVLSLDLQALQSTQLGSKLLNVIQQNVQEEIGKASKKSVRNHGKKSSEQSADDSQQSLGMEKVIEILGMNPLEEIQSVVVHASEFEHPEKSMIARIRLKQNTGNIEGLLVGLPGYESEEVGSYTIHSAKPDDRTQVFGCLNKGSDGNYTFYFASDKTALVEILKSTETAAPGISLRSLEIDDNRKTFLNLQLTDLAGINVGEGPQANIAKMLKGLAISIAEEDENIEFRSTLTAATVKKAEQLKQTVQGLVAMVELFASMVDQDKDLQAMIAHVKQVKVTQDDTKLRIRWSMPSAEIAKILEEEMKDKK